MFKFFQNRDGSMRGLQTDQGFFDSDGSYVGQETTQGTFDDGGAFFGSHGLGPALFEDDEND